MTGKRRSFFPDVYYGKFSIKFLQRWENSFILLSLLPWIEYIRSSINPSRLAETNKILFLCCAPYTHTLETSNICAFLSLTYWFSLAFPNRPLFILLLLLLSFFLSIVPFSDISVFFSPHQLPFHSTHITYFFFQGKNIIFYAPTATTAKQLQLNDIVHKIYISCIGKEKNGKIYFGNLYVCSLIRRFW